MHTLYRRTVHIRDKWSKQFLSPMFDISLIFWKIIALLPSSDALYTKPSIIVFHPFTTLWYMCVNVQYLLTYRPGGLFLWLHSHGCIYYTYTVLKAYLDYVSQSLDIVGSHKITYQQYYSCNISLSLFELCQFHFLHIRCIKRGCNFLFFVVVVVVGCYYPSGNSKEARVISLQSWPEYCSSKNSKTAALITQVSPHSTY